MPDIDGDENPNSKRKSEEQEWEDKLNNVRMNHKSGGCKDKATGTEAELHHTLPTTSDPNEKALRCVVTVSFKCETA